MVPQAFDLVTKGLGVLEAAVHRGEAHVADLIQVAQLLHHQLADRARGHLALAQHPQLVADAAHGLLDCLGADRPLLQCLDHAVREFALVERFAAAVALDDARHQQLRGLKGREALTAAQALAPAADLAAVGGQPRIGHLGLDVAAEWTMHRLPGSGFSPRTPEIGHTARSPAGARARSWYRRRRHPEYQRSTRSPGGSRARENRAWSPPACPAAGRSQSSAGADRSVPRSC